jgi:hypothetical protein
VIIKDRIRNVEGSDFLDRNFAVTLNGAKMMRDGEEETAIR